jgi:hypothetical protein
MPWKYLALDENPWEKDQGQLSFPALTGQRSQTFDTDHSEEELRWKRTEVAQPCQRRVTKSNPPNRPLGHVFGCYLHSVKHPERNRPILSQTQSQSRFFRT